jgi:acetyl-CoA acetyltransferase
MIADPFRLFDCSLESDGGAAVIVSAADRARDLKKPRVTIMGVAEGHPESPASIAQRPDVLAFGLAKAAARGYAMAGVGPKDIDVAEIYDCFTFTVINQLELLGFCKKGEGGPFVMDGRIALGGKIHSWTVCHHPFNFFFKQMAPYIVALVDMDAGVRVNAQLRGVAESDLRIGDRVRLAFEPVTGDITLPYFMSG